MIVIGSFAAAAHGLGMGRPVGDIDLIGSVEELNEFKNRNRSLILSQEALHGHRVRFTMRQECGYEKVEFDHEQSPSDRMLEGLCHEFVELLNDTAKLPSLDLLYLTKRAHANVPVFYAKTISDLITLKPHAGNFGSRELCFYEHRKRECRERYSTNRQRFSLAISNQDFFSASNHVRLFEHDDIHEAVAHTIGSPLYKRCKRDLSTAKIEKDLFEALAPSERLMMVQEEFMVIGLERFYVHDKTLSNLQIYRRGMHKTIRDLFVGYFQDFCIDHIDQLLDPPPFDFIKRFACAVADGRVRPLARSMVQPGEAHAKVGRLLNQSQFAEARSACEDLIRASDNGNDPDAFYLLGLALSGLDSFEPAVKCFRACVIRDPQYADAWFQLGRHFRLGKRPKDALQCLNKAGQLKCANPSLFIELGCVCMELDDKSRAVAVFNHALKFPGVKEEARLQLLALDPKPSFSQDICLSLSLTPFVEPSLGDP